jgi:N-acetylglucosamine-6-sulfatase
VLKTCKGRACTHPWEKIHPNSNVHSLRDAVNPKFDTFYEAQEKLYWTQCEQAYVRESEGPEGVETFMWHEVAL